MSSLNRTASFVIVSKATGEAVAEVFNRKAVSKINTAKYDVVPILQYLQSLNH